MQLKPVSSLREGLKKAKLQLDSYYILFQINSYIVKQQKPNTV